MKLLRTIRLDPSDTFVFDKAAEPGEWAVPGGFAFAAVDPTKLQGKARVAFRSGFLGIASLGWSTLVQIVETSEQDRAAAAALLSDQLLTHFGAPDRAAAQEAAAEETSKSKAKTSNRPSKSIWPRWRKERVSEVDASLLVQICRVGKGALPDRCCAPFGHRLCAPCPPSAFRWATAAPLPTLRRGRGVFFK